VKLSILTLLGLGVFASTAAIVRLTVTLNLSATTDFLYYAMPVAAWAQVELALGVVLANLSALRPLLEKLLDLRSTLRSSKKRSMPVSSDRYMELEERVKDKRNRSISERLSMSNGHKTRIHSMMDANVLIDDDDSTRNIVDTDRCNDSHSVQVNRQFDVSYNNTGKE
jgi:hypothetical protein